MRGAARRLSLLAIGALWVSLTPCAGSAQVRDREARALFEQGVAAARESRWEEARELFVQADARLAHPNIRINLAAALVQTGRLRAAIAMYELVLEEHARQVRERAAELRTALDGVRSRLATLEVRLDGAADGDALEVDSEAVTIEGGRALVPADPGRHVIEVRRGAESVERREVEVGEGQRLVVSIEVSDPSTPERVATGSSEPSQTEPNWAAIGLIGGGTLVLGGLLYPWIRLNDIQNGEELAAFRADFTLTTSSICVENAREGRVFSERLGEICSEADALFAAQWVLLGVGGAAVVVGALLMAVQGPELEVGPSARLLTVIGPGLAALGLSVDLDVR